MSATPAANATEWSEPEAKHQVTEDSQMDTPLDTKTASIDKKIELIRAILEIEQYRREALDNKCQVLIASNAILMGALLGIGIPIAYSSAMSILLWFRAPLVLVAFGASLVSILCATRVYDPITSDKQRRRILDLGPEPEFNLIWEGKIAKYGRDQYLKHVNALTEKQIFEQLGTNAHHISRILEYRYRFLGYGNYAFVFSLTAFVILALTKMLSGPAGP